MRGDTGVITIAAGGKYPVKTGDSNYLHVYDADGLIVVEMKKQRKTVEFATVARLTTLNGRDYDELVLTDISGSNNDVRIFYGPHSYQPNDRADVTINNSDPLEVDIVSGSVTVNESLPTDFVPLDDVTVGNSATEIAAADPDSLYIEIAIKPDAANGIRLGDGTVGATKGRWLGPGMSTHINIQNHAIYGIRDGSEDVDVTITRLDVP